MYTASVMFEYYCRDSELLYVGGGGGGGRGGSAGDCVSVCTSLGGSWGL